jgi:hypothetical protein
VLPIDVLNARFPYKPHPEDFPSPAISHTPTAVLHSPHTIVLSSLQQPDLHLRIAYGSFFVSQLSLGLAFAFFYKTDIRASLGCIAGASLAVVFFTARNEPVNMTSTFGRQLATIFSLHTLALLSITLHSSIRHVSHGCEGFQLVMGALYLFWTICGTMSIKNSLHG